MVCFCCIETDYDWGRLPLLRSCFFACLAVENADANATLVVDGLLNHYS